MKKVVGFLILMLSLATAAFADKPQLVVYFAVDDTIQSVQIFSTSEWNRDDLDEQKIAALQKVNVFCSSPTAYEVVREVTLAGQTVTAKFQFPAQKGGRELNESTRFELSLYEGERLFFHSLNFGQPAEEFTTMPESGVKFRPQSLSLSVSGGQLQVKVSGLFGTSAFADGVETQKGMTITRAITGNMIDDQFMNDLANSLAAGAK